MGGDASALVAIGLSHHTAPVHVRETLAYSADEIRAELGYLRQSELAREAMLISTCNRVELYAVTDGASERLHDYMARRRAGGEPLGQYLYAHRGAAAVRHLFRVAASLDSLVVGEPQILGQVKEAVRIAGEADALGSVLNRLTQRTMWVAKQVRTNTDIGKANVGIGNAGVFLAQQIFSTLRGRRVLLVGAGEMGRQVAKAMVNSGIKELLVANRTASRTMEVAEEFGATALRYEHFHEYLHRVDIVITATGATRPIISVSDVQQAMRSRRYRPLFLVDLAVPRNIAPEVENLDQAYLFNVDDLTQVMDKGKQARAAASEAAERIVEAETERFSERLATLEVNEAIGDITRQVEQIRQDELGRSRKLLATLTPEQREAVDRMTKSMLKKVLHRPLREIRQGVRDHDTAKVETLLAAWHQRDDD